MKVVRNFLVAAVASLVLLGAGLESTQAGPHGTSHSSHGWRLERYGSYFTQCDAIRVANAINYGHARGWRAARRPVCSYAYTNSRGQAVYVWSVYAYRHF